MHLPVAAWAWILVALACADLLVLALTGALLLRQVLRRHRPLLRLARALEDGDLDRARFHLDRVPLPEGRDLGAFCRRTVESGPVAQARDRLLRGCLAVYPAPPLLTKLAAVVLAGTGAALPAVFGCVGWTNVLANAAQTGEPVPTSAGTLLAVGAVESAALGLAAAVLVVLAHRLDPGAPGTQRRLVRMLSGDRG